MAARVEWTEWHLTPRGWERGSTRVHGKGNTWIDEPEDRFLSFVYKQVETSSSPIVTESTEETWRPRNQTGLAGLLSAESEDLLKRYGPCPKSL